jgi:hypothetical protein
MPAPLTSSSLELLYCCRWSPNTRWRLGEREADMEFAIRTVLIGLGATAIMDLWTVLLRWLFGVSSLDYAMVGRWLGHMPAGQFAHASIADARAVRGERVIGWVAHYASGVVFAGMLIAACGLGWAHSPTLAPANRGRHSDSGRALLHHAAGHGLWVRSIAKAECQCGTRAQFDDACHLWPRALCVSVNPRATHAAVMLVAA